jgi:vancomycin resistance protein YoaR
MKRIIGWTAGALVLGGGAFVAFASLQEATAAKGTQLFGQDLSGMPAKEIRTRLNDWWSRAQAKKLQPTCAESTQAPAPMTYADLGVEPDWDKTISAIKFDSYANKLLGQELAGAPIHIAWKFSPKSFTDLARFIEDHAREPHPASVRMEAGVIKRDYEGTSFKLDEAEVGRAAIDAILQGKQTFELPLDQAPPKISRADIDSIRDVVSQFTTKFNAGNRNRSSNIRLAASIIDGTVVMPGETFSYNETVGRRTAEKGFKMAGVYKNGKHDVDFGGGICQVSTTLFNAAALADLKIVARSNHSMPVPYVPLGRDATVDYGSLDLKFQNSMSTPIAITSAVSGGTITFKILGTKLPSGMKVTMETSDHRSWGNKVQYVTDPNLAPGRTKVVERGSAGRACVTWRVVELNGNVTREKLAESNYRATPRIIARGPVRKAPPSTPPLAAPPSASPPVAEPPSPPPSEL